MKGHDAIAKALVDQGVDTMFGVLGDANLFIAENMMREHGIHYTAATHEANAVLMAEGYAKASGKLGVATVTHGPGLSNTVTALIEGTRGGTPLLLVSGDTPTEDLHHLQNIGQRELVLATGAGFQAVRSPDTISEDVAIAVRRADVERRPIVLNIPLEFEWADVTYEPAPEVAPLARGLAPDPVSLDTAVGLIASATRPLILAGRGAVRSGARDALIRLGERLGAPLATSLLGSGYFRGEPFDLGIFGTLATPIAAETIASADCIIAFGASLNYFTTHEGSLVAGKRLVQCELDPNKIGQNVGVDVGVVGDATRIAETMIEWLEAADHQPASFTSPQLAASLGDFNPADAFDDKSRDDAVDPRTATLRLEEILPTDRTLVVDAGRFMLDALTLSVPDPLALVTSHTFGAIGLGMSNAIGAAVARPDRPVVFVAGDGGFMMGGMTEFSTAVHHGFDMIVIVYNDGSYGAEHIQLYRKQMDPTASLHHWPSFTAVAAAMGADAVMVRNLADFDAASEAIKNRTPDKPVFIEVTLDPDMVSSIPR